MTRSLCVLAILGLGADPGRAGVFRPCWSPPPPCGYGYYAVPVYPVYPIAPPVWVVPAAPMAAAPTRPATDSTGSRPPLARPTAPPRLELVPAANQGADAPRSPNPAPAPPAETVRPASDWVPAAKPTAAPPPAPDNLPPINLPLAPAAPAPSPDAKKPDALPPLVLPPDVPGGPSGVVPGSTSKASPLGGPSVQVLTASGASTAAGTRTVGFFNHTGKAVELVIDGRAVTLPRKSYLHAEVPPAFKWRYNGNPAEAATVPDDAAGLDIVFRE